MLLPPVVTEHLLELAFLAIQRRKLLFAPDVPVVSFPDHDERIAAHWDGLMVAAPASVDLALARMEEFDPWETYAAARVWLELGAPATTEIITRIAASDPAVHGAWREALRRTPRARVSQLLPPNDLPRETAAGAVLIYAWGAHDMLPDALAASAAFNTEPDMRRCLARALGWSTSTTTAQQLLQTLLADPDETVRSAALWSIALAQPQVAANHCRQRVRSGTPDIFDFRALGLLGTGNDLGVLSEYLRTTGPHRAVAVEAMGNLGSPVAIELLLEVLMDASEKTSAAALQAIATIVGAPPGADAPPVGEAEAEADDAATIPVDIPMLREWWRARCPEFPSAARFLRAQPFPWAGAAGEEPMEAIWRSLFHYSRPEYDSFRYEVPDGFFEAELRSDAVPGE